MHTTSVRPFSLLLFLSVVTAAPALAGPVVGRVLDPSGRAIAGAGVLIVSGAPDDGWGRVRQTFSDNIGAASDDVDPWLNYRNAQLWSASSRVRALEAWVRR